MTLSLGVAGWCVVLFAVTAAITAGRWVSRRTSSGSEQGTLEFILAGRSLTAPMFAITLIATWYGSVLASGEFIVRNGIMFAFCFGAPYYVAAILYAFFLSGKIRSSKAVSIPATIRNTFGKGAGIASAFAVAVIAIPAPFMLSLGIVIEALTQWPLWVCIVTGTACSLFIVAKGGLRSDVAANTVQLSVMYLGFAVLAVACVASYGTPTTMLHSLPAETLSIPGPIGWSGVVVWFLIALQTFVDPNFHMRTAAVRTPSAARNGLLVSVIGWAVFDLLQLTIGLYGIAYLPHAEPQWHFLVVAQAVLPDVLKGLFVAGVLSAIMSTLDGYALSSATTIGHDIWGAFSAPNTGKKRLVISLIITGVGGTAAAISVSSIVDLIVMAASIAVPGLLLPLLASLWKPLKHIMRKKQGSPAWLLIIAPSAVAAVTLLYNHHGQYSIQPMFTGILASIVLLPFTKVHHG